MTEPRRNTFWVRYCFSRTDVAGWPTNYKCRLCDWAIAVWQANYASADRVDQATMAIHLVEQHVDLEELRVS